MLVTTAGSGNLRTRGRFCARECPPPVTSTQALNPPLLPDRIHDSTAESLPFPLVPCGAFQGHHPTVRSCLLAVGLAKHSSPGLFPEDVWPRSALQVWAS